MCETISEVGRTYLRWALTDDVGPLTFARMLIQLGDPAAALGASAATLQTVKGIGVKRADSVARSRDTAPVDDEIAAAAEHDIRIICRADVDYPTGLKQIPDAPIVLYVKGELRATDAVALAIVGTRRCTIYGSEQARRFGELLAGAGFTVISGLARGIDSFAQHGAVDAGGRSIAVMGRGLTEIYPPENVALAEKVRDHGAWVTEFPVRAEVRASNFISRNRIIAGMALGTLIVEAPQRSGALSTGRYTIEYNRELFAVPGRAQDAMSQGSNALIRDGSAKLVMSLEDILDELGDVGERMGVGAWSDKPKETQPKRPERDLTSLSAIERKVYDATGYDPLLQDVLITLTGLPPGDFLAAITSLELKGLVRRLPGNLVLRRGRA